MSALAEALVAAQAELPCALGKDATGQIGNRDYRYLTLDKLIAETRPILTKHGLTIVQFPSYEIVGDHAIPTLRTRIMHSASDGYTVAGAAFVGEAIEHAMPLYLADKSMQGLAAAITYARRYAWAAVLGIAAEEDTDAPADPDAGGPF